MPAELCVSADSDTIFRLAIFSKIGTTVSVKNSRSCGDLIAEISRSKPTQPKRQLTTHRLEANYSTSPTLEHLSLVS